MRVFSGHPEVISMFTSGYWIILDLSEIILLIAIIMERQAISIRPFVGAKDFDLSRSFYRDLGFKEVMIASNLSLFIVENLGFYLQDAYVKDWIDNTMVFLEVGDVDRRWRELSAMDLVSRYPGVRLSTIRVEDWGRECFLHDPSGVLWHFGEFSTKP